jgi:ATP-dependent DNA helicase PIF1
MPNIKLTPDQTDAFTAATSGRNICLTGPAGTGKSFLLDQLRDHFKGGLDVTASTGIAALNVGGATIHSWAGLGLGEDPVPYIVSQIVQRRKVCQRLRDCRRLAIDEVSMLSDRLLGTLSEVLSAVRDDPRPFGGIQMLFIGDFLQLPPVSRRGDEVGFAFNSPLWKSAGVEVHELTTIVRQKEESFASVLNKVRKGIVDDEVRDTLLSRVKVKDPDPTIKPVRLQSTNEAADRINQHELYALPGEACRSHADDWGDGSALDRLKRDCIAPEVLDLKIGAQVMLLKNLDLELGLVNGSLGVLESFDGKLDGESNLPVVAFKNGSFPIATAAWEIKVGREVVARRIQFPLRMAWAITIHKSQGMTLDKLEADLSGGFAPPGMFYVAMSRARTLEGLFLTGLDVSKIRAHPDALEFYEKNRRKSLCSETA